jgi:hypothetical protein
MAQEGFVDWVFVDDGRRLQCEPGGCYGLVDPDLEDVEIVA